MINILKFTKLRKRLFIGFSIFFVGMLLLSLILVNLYFCEKFLPNPETLAFYLLGISFAVVSYSFLVPGLLAYSLFGDSSFNWVTGFAPGGIHGLLITIIFYLVLAFLLSWIGNLKKDSKLNEKGSK